MLHICISNFGKVLNNDKDGFYAELYFENSPIKNIEFYEPLAMYDDDLIKMSDTDEDCCIEQSGDTGWCVNRKNGVYTISYWVGDRQETTSEIEVELPSQQMKKHIVKLDEICQYFRDEGTYVTIEHIIQNMTDVEISYDEYYAGCVYDIESLKKELNDKKLKS